MQQVINLIFLMLCSLLFYCEDIYSIYLVFISICLQFFAGKLILLDNKKIFFLNTPFLFYLYHEIFIAVGAVLIFIFPVLLLHTFLDTNILINRLGIYMLNMSISIFMFAIGSVVIRRRKELTVSNNKNYFDLIFVMFIVASLIGTMRYILHFDFANIIRKVILFELSGTDARREFTESQFSGGEYFGQGYFNLVIYQIVPIFSIALLLQANQLKMKKMQIIVLLVTVLLQIGELRRAPIMQYIVGVIFVGLLSNVKRKIELKKLLIGIFVLFGGMLLMTVFLGRDEGDIKKLLLNIVYRIFISQTQTGTYVFQFIPLNLNFAYGSIYVKNIIDMMPGPSIGFATELYMLAHDGRMGAASHSAFAEAYANFSVFGSIFLGLILGIWFKMTSCKINSESNDVLSLTSFIIFIAYVIPAIATGSIIGALLQYFILIIIIMCIKMFAPIFNLRKIYEVIILQSS